MMDQFYAGWDYVQSMYAKEGMSDPYYAEDAVKGILQHYFTEQGIDFPSYADEDLGSRVSKLLKTKGKKAEKAVKKAVDSMYREYG